MTRILTEQRTPAGNAYLTVAIAGRTLIGIAHGWRDSPQAWQWVTASLLGREAGDALDVVAVRRRAGDLGGLEPPALLDAYAAQVVDSINAAAPGVERVVLVGQPMGGASRRAEDFTAEIAEDADGTDKKKRREKNLLPG